MDVNESSGVTFTSCDDVLKICKRYFAKKKVNVTHLNFIHKNNDGTVFYLCSNHFWIKHYIKNGYHHIGAFETKPYLSNERYVLWDSLDRSDIILEDSRKLIQVEHGLTIIDKHKEGTSFFNIGTNDSSYGTINNYLNQLDKINGFIPYFYLEANNIIKTAHQQKIILNPFIVLPETQKFGIKEKIFISQRESDCIEYYLKGKKSGEIAHILNISRRTVETHIENVKIKLGCTNLFQLGYSIAKLKLASFGFIPEFE